MVHFDLFLKIPGCCAKDAKTLVGHEHAEKIDEGNPHPDASKPDCKASS